MSERIHVVAAVITNKHNDVLIAKRPDHLHQGGLWEFPGGKVEADESVRVALDRELLEEIGIRVQTARPLIKVSHDYADKSVLLDVWQVSAFEGEAHGRENQAIRWVTLQSLNDFSFPAANAPIIKAACLPDNYLITPECADEAQFFAALKNSLTPEVTLMQLRCKSLEQDAFRRLSESVVAFARSRNCRVLLNTDNTSMVKQVKADGVHLSSQRLRALRARPLNTQYLVGASCHNLEELAHAADIDVDFAVLSPVCQTPSHPDVASLGWEQFEAWVNKSAIPVFALGGLTLDDRSHAFRHGAQGLAGIRLFWRG